MLSRSAERVYWAGRYLERAENTARMVQQYAHLMLDLPPEVGVGWQDLVAIIGAQSQFDTASGEQATLDFLLADPNGGVSLAFCIGRVRDNIRNSRDLLPTESWEAANELHRFAKRQLNHSAMGENRFDVLSECIGRCQQINGTLTATMSHTSPYHFLQLGQHIERADMTSRMIDVAAAYLQQNERLVLRYGSTLWTNVLKSVSAFQMYRQYCQPKVEGLAAIDFLLNDDRFPRAVRACLDTASRTAAALPNSEPLQAELAQVREALPAALPRTLDGAGVTALMDTLQIGLGGAHLKVVDTWFLPAS
ncbi:MAG: alpha-E domain-containing protein [Pseudomonadota bacterium]